MVKKEVEMSIDENVLSGFIERVEKEKEKKSNREYVKPREDSFRYRVLKYIEEESEKKIGVSMKEISVKMGRIVNYIYRVCEELEKKGLIVKVSMRERKRVFVMSSSVYEKVKKDSRVKKVFVIE